MTVITSAGTGTGNQFMNPSGNVPSPNPPANPNNDPNPAQPAVPQPSDKTPKNPLAWWEEHIQFMEDFRQSQLDAGKGDPFLLPESFSSDDEDASGSGSGDASGSGSGDATSGTEDDPFGRTEGQSSQLFDVGDFSKHFEGTPPQNEREAYKLLYDFRKISGNPDPRDLDTFYNAEKNQGYNVFEKLAKEMADKQIADKDNDFTLLPGITLKEGSPQYNYFINEKFTKQYNRYFTAKPHNTMKSIYSHLYLVLHLTTDPDSGPSMGTFDEWYETAKTRIADPVEMLANVYFKVHTYGLHIFEPMNNDITPEFREYIEAERRKNPYYYLGLKDNKFHVNDIKGSFRTQLRHVPDAEIARLNAQTSRDVLRKVVQFINNARNDDKDMGEFFDKLLQEAYDPNIGILKILGLRLNEIYSLQKDNKIPVVPNFDFQTADGLINMMMFANFNTDYFYPGSADKKKGELKRWYESWKHAKDLRQDVGFNFKGKYYENFITHKNDRPYVNRAEDLPDLGETAGNDQSIGVTPAPTSTTTTSPPDGFEFSGVGGFKRPRQGDVPKYQGEDMVWDKTNPKGNEKRTFDGREILKGWMPRYKVDKDGLTKEFNTDTGKYEITTYTYSAGSAQAPAPAPASSPQDDDTTDTGGDTDDDEAVRPPNIIPSSTRKPRPAKPVKPTPAGRYYNPPSGANALPQGYFSVEVLPQGRFNYGANENEDFVGEQSATGLPIDDTIFRNMNPQSDYIDASNAGRDEVYFNPNWERQTLEASKTYLNEPDVDNTFLDEVRTNLFKDMKDKIGDEDNPYYDVDVLASQSAYAPLNERVKDILGYKYNPTYSDQFIAVYEKGDTAIIAYKGTDTTFEHMSNFMDITSGEFLDSAHFKNMMDVTRTYVYNNLDNKKMIRCVGHSRGGASSFYTSAVLGMEFWNRDITIEGSGFAVGGFYPGITKILAKGILGGDRNTFASAGIVWTINKLVELTGLQRHIALEAVMPSKLGMAISGLAWLKDQIINSEKFFGMPIDTTKYHILDADGKDTGLYTATNNWRSSLLVNWVSKNLFNVDRDLLLRADPETMNKIKKSLQVQGEEVIKRKRKEFEEKFPFVKEFTLPKYIGANVMARAVQAGYKKLSEDVVEEALETRRQTLETYREEWQAMLDNGDTFAEVQQDFIDTVNQHLDPELNPQMDALRRRQLKIKFIDELLGIYNTAFKIKYLLNNFFNSEMQAIDKLINADLTGDGQPDFTRRFRSYGVKYNPNTYIFESQMDKAGYTDIVSGYTKNKIKSFVGRQAELTTQVTFPVTAPAELITGSGIPSVILAPHNLVNYIKPQYRTPQQMQEIVRALRNLKYRKINDMGIPLTIRGRQELISGFSDEGLQEVANNLEPINPGFNNEELQEIANNYVFA